MIIFLIADLCSDEYADCPQWAVNGDCNSDPYGKTRYCHKSCLFCGKFYLPVILSFNLRPITYTLIIHIPTF